MEFCIVTAEGVIENIIVADEAFAASIGAMPSHAGAAIGAAYDPPPTPAPEPEMTVEERLDSLEDALAQTDETAIELYEANEEQQSINAAQDEALIEIYEMLEG